MPNVGSFSMWGFGVAFGVLGVAVLLYWLLDEYRDADDATETIEGVAERSGSAIVVGASVLLTVGDVFMTTLGELAGLIDAPVVVGHVVGGVLGFAGVSGFLTSSQFLIGFGIVTVVAVTWRYTGEEEGM